MIRLSTPDGLVYVNLAYVLSLEAFEDGGEESWTKVTMGDGTYHLARGTPAELMAVFFSEATP